MDSSVYPLAFNLIEGNAEIARLLTLSFTDEANTSRLSLNFTNGICANIKSTSNSDTDGKRIKYVSNPDGASPLLLSVPGAYNKMKFEVNVSQKECDALKHAALVIYKSFEPVTNLEASKAKLSHALTQKSGNVSKILLAELAPEDEARTVIINDTIKKHSTQGAVLTVSVWCQIENEISSVFSFQVWIDDTDFESFLVPSQVQSIPLVPDAKQPGLTGLDIQDLRKAFNFDIHDGPEFRTALAAYEQNCPKLRKAMLNLQDEVRGLESCLKRFINTRNRLFETLEAVVNLQFSPLLKKLNILKGFSGAFKSIFEPFENNLLFITRDIFSLQSMSKMVGSCLSSATPDNSESASSRKSFEKSSKEYYDWLHKYLSNEKDRPVSKLLLKRKAFEISKFDYLSALNASSNNQYFNQLLENFFKLANLPKENGMFDFKTFRDNKKSQGLLSDNASLYLNGLSRFNSEKLQFRQMIETCRTNEELTNLIKFNSLNSLSSHVNEAPIRGEKLRIDTSSTNLDMLFPNSPVNISPSNDATTSTSWNGAEDDQNANFAGILYALGGQGKPGWHKEWVVLQKGQLIEYSDWRNGTQPINRPIDIALASVKPVTKEKRQFCLEIMTSLGQKHVFQAINDDERNQWIKALHNAGQLTERLTRKAPKPKLITNFPKPPTQILPEDDGRGSPVSVYSESFGPSDDNFLQSVRSIEGSKNSICADCKSADSVEWISMTFLVVICIKCSSCHRNMGSHISKVRSLKLDNFLEENRVLLNHTNNATVNSYLEANVPEKITPDASDNQRLHYIRQKYEQRAFMTKLTNINSLLVKATRKIDVDEVIQYLNCGADPNLSLSMSSAQAADPLTVTLFEYSLRKIIQVKGEGGGEHGYFVISELLLLHGCNIESLSSLNPRVVGSEEAKAYWSKRRARALAS